MGDMIDRDAALALTERKVGRDHPALSDELRHAIAALPAVTVGVKPLRYFFAQGETVDQVREHAQAHPLAKEGDMKLVWVNEGDLYDHSIFLAALEPQPAPDAAAIREAANLILQDFDAILTIAGKVTEAANSGRSSTHGVRLGLNALIPKGADGGGAGRGERDAPPLRLGAGQGAHHPSPPR